MVSGFVVPQTLSLAFSRSDSRSEIFPGAPAANPRLQP